MTEIKTLGKVISVKLVDKVKLEDKSIILTPKKRPYELIGKTYALKTRLLKHTLYMTINNIHEDGKLKPFEIFFKSKDNRKVMELDILSTLLSSSFRKEDNIQYLIDHIQSVNSSVAGTGYFRPPREAKGEVKGFNVPSIYYEIGEVIQDHLDNMKNTQMPESPEVITIKVGTIITHDVPKAEMFISKDECPECFENNIQMVAGCETCMDCGWSACG